MSRLQRNKEDEFFQQVRKEKRMKAPEAARQKSLFAFQNGLKDREDSAVDRKGAPAPRHKLAGVIAGTFVFAISLVLVLSVGVMEEKQTETGSDGNMELGAEGDRDEQQEPLQDSADIAVHSEVGMDDVMDKVLIRPPINIERATSIPTRVIFHGTLHIPLSHGWTYSESTSGKEYHSQMSRSEKEHMNLLLFEEPYSEGEFDDHIAELTAGFSEAEQFDVPLNDMIKQLKEDFGFSYPYPNVFPFEAENTELTVFYNREDGQVLELYVSEMFGYPMIFTSEFPYEDEEGWKRSITFLAFLEPELPLDVHRSEGEIDPVYNRPVDKSVILRVGAIAKEQVDMELHVIEEFGLSGYLPKGTEMERIEHEHIVEWRFNEPGVSENSFYSIGKLKQGISIERGREVLFNAHGIDESYLEVGEGVIPHYYGYYSGEEFIDGHFRLFEQDGEWYYEHLHADRNDYNGGVYYQRLNYYIESLEWY